MSLEQKIDGALIRLAARHADAVRAAFVSAINPEQIADAWVAMHKQKTTPAEARAWAQNNVQFSTVRLEAVIRDIYGDGWILGRDSARAHYAMRVIKKADAPFDFGQAVSTDWDTWVPGNEAAAALTRPSGGLANLLNRSRPKFIKGMKETQLDRIGTVISSITAAEQGVPGAVKALIADEVLKLAKDPNRALSIAMTETNRALNVAAADNYQQWGVEQVEWFVVDESDDTVCELCQANADQGPINLGDEFDSGDTEPPGHPNCRCALAPVIPDNVDVPAEVTAPDAPMEISADSSHAISDVLAPKSTTLEGMAINKDGVPGPAEVERALSRLSILPGPTDVTLGDKAAKYVASPWEVIPMPTVDPNLWDKAVQIILPIGDLSATDNFLKRSRVENRILAMGQAGTPFRSLPLIADDGTRKIILDGHHRLMAQWLLGNTDAPVWKVEI